MQNRYPCRLVRVTWLDRDAPGAKLGRLEKTTHAASESAVADAMYEARTWVGVQIYPWLQESTPEVDGICIPTAISDAVRRWQTLITIMTG